MRDVLLGLSPGHEDVDVVVEGDAVRLARALTARRPGKVTAHTAFKTATLQFKDGSKVDFATARREVYAHPAALPTVTPSSIREDLFRRDFTINAMAVDLSPKTSGYLVDFFGGRQDLHRRWIRVLHPKSFIDDPTRIFNEAADGSLYWRPKASVH